MNKVIIFLFFGIIVLSIQCERTVWSRTVEFFVKNETEKTFYIHIQPTQSFAYYKDTLRGCITPFSVFRGTFFSGKTTQRMASHGLFSTDIFLYSLSDTTTVSESRFDGGSYDIVMDKFLSPYISYKNEYSLEDTFFLETNILLITENLVQIMQKDYTMLEKFKDYYSQPH